MDNPKPMWNTVTKNVKTACIFFWKSCCMQHFLLVKANVSSAGYALLKDDGQSVEQTIGYVHLEVTIRGNEEIKLGS